MKKYYFLAALIVLIYFSFSFFMASGGVGADSLSYFGIASDLPQLKSNLFPLGFPLLLRFFHLIFQDYFWAGKFLNLAMILIILLFSYYKKFYFKETVLLFAGKTLFFSMIYVMSEGPFIFFMYFLIYIFHERFQNRLSSRKFVLLASLLIFILFTVRYSGIYIYLGIGVFWLMMMLKNKSFVANKDIFLLLVVSGFAIVSYLAFNHFVYGSFTGENARGMPAHYDVLYILRDILGVTNVVDPFIGLKPASNSMVSIGFQIGLMFLDLLLLLYFIKLVKAKKKFIQMEFHQFLWIVAGVYTFALFISGIVQQIEEMNVRMLAAANLCLFFSFLLIYFKDLKSDRFIFRLGFFFLMFLTLYGLKSPSNYFKNRKQIEPQMTKFQHKKFMYNNETGGEKSLTTYHIPIINKSFKYKHTANQIGDIKHSIAGTINPQIKWLKRDTIKDKSKVLYTSEIILK